MNSNPLSSIVHEISFVCVSTDDLNLRFGRILNIQTYVLVSAVAYDEFVTRTRLVLPTHLYTLSVAPDFTTHSS